MANPLSDYSKSIEGSLLAGNATEHTHRPAQKTLIEALAAGVKVINEPQRIACGAPDLVVLRSDLRDLQDSGGLRPIGYVEAKDVGKSLDDAEHSEQLRRYLRALPNLLLTDYLEFRWYVDGERRAVARLARPGAAGKLTAEKDGSQAVRQLLGDFLSHKPQPIASSQALAVRMARLAHMTRDTIVAGFEQGQVSDLLAGWRKAFAHILIADLEQPEKTGEFADMLAQTLAYGLFSARVMDTSPGFTRQEAQHLIPKTNPFVRDFFYQVSGPQMDDEPFAGFVADLCRQIISNSWQHLLPTNQITDDCYVSNRTRERGYTLPFYLYPVGEHGTAKQSSWLQSAPWPPDISGRVPNLAPAFVAEVESRLGLKFACGAPGGEGFTPEDLFGYIYAVFHAPAYRSRYAQFLKIDFPRVPIPSVPALFWRLAELGRELVALHLLDADAAPLLLKPITRFPVAGDGLVEKGHSRYDEANRRVFISVDSAKAGKQGQYFEGVPPEVWRFHVGGYQPCQKWLKDRAGRRLTYDDLTHYQRIVVSLKETIRLMAEVDATIPAWPIR